MKKADENTSAEGIEAREFWIATDPSDTMCFVYSDYDSALKRLQSGLKRPEHWNNPEVLHLVEAAPVLEKIKQLEAELKAVGELYRGEQLKHYEKQSDLRTEIYKLNEVISMQREALEFISKNPTWAHETNQELCLTYGNFTVEHAKKALAKADELMKGNE